MDTLFSVIVPVYNRIDEVEALLQSLQEQTVKNFEVLIVEDGSTEPCASVCERYAFVRYFMKPNEGRSIARNYGMERAAGRYFIFFDSDCVIPSTYFATLTRLIATHPEVDCFGGPDAAHESFTPVQKAINFAMTSFVTTGGIRGGKVQMEKFTPRTFNMGFSRRVYEAVGGFREMFSEDIDMSMRIRQAGFNTNLFREAAVYHRRRVDLRKFFRQVYVFGMSRITLHLLYPGSLKAVHCLPALFLLGCVALILLGIAVSPWFLMPIAAYVILLLITAAFQTRSLRVTALAIPASFIQLWGYGAGFIKAFTLKILLRRQRNVADEVKIRKGANEQLR
jgi:glycosyltransferase involved in cell wall biosynthesis